MPRTRLILSAIFLFAAIARLILWWINPPNNAYDDHLEVIAYFAREGVRPNLDECFQCYQPPMYYAAAAITLRVSEFLSNSYWVGWKTVQLLGVVFSIANLWVIWRILDRLSGNIPRGARFVALSAIAFLPRDVYTGAFITNDVPLSLWVSLALAAYLSLLRTTDEKSASASAKFPSAFLLVCASAVIASWTKQSGLLVCGLVILALVRVPILKSYIKSWSLGVFALLLALVDEGVRFAYSGSVLASNQLWFNWASEQPPGSIGEVSFFDFRFATLLNHPQISLDEGFTLPSFWTEIFARFWFDYEPKLLLVDSEAGMVLSTLSYGLGAIFMMLWVVGAVRLARGALPREVGLAVVAVQFVFLLVPLIQTARFPYFSSMKSVFCLPASSAAAILIALGAASMWKSRWWRWSTASCCGFLALVILGQLALIYGTIGAVLEMGPLWIFPRLW